MEKGSTRGTRKSKSGIDYQIFVSHATTDKWIAKVICDKLQIAGASTFRDDRDIKGGDDIPEEIRRQIKRSKEVLVLLTPLSLGKEWVRWEMACAWAMSKRIIVVRYHVEIDPIPEMIKSKKVIHHGRNELGKRPFKKFTRSMLLRERGNGSGSHLAKCLSRLWFRARCKNGERHLETRSRSPFLQRNT